MKDKFMIKYGEHEKPVSFISCDWGTSRFRLALVRNGRMVRSVRRPDGVGTICRRSDFPRVLAQGLSELRAPAGLPVVISGMASSSIGWRELPYARLPFSLTGSDAVWAEIQPGVYLVSGVASRDDMMRGEETQLLGLPVTGEAMVILPGTHSKHALVRGGKLVGFQTFMTGELFAATAEHTVLSRSVAGCSRFDRHAFASGVEASVRQTVSASLFQVRTRDVLAGAGKAANRSFLSGIWIGSELSALPAGLPVWLCASTELAPAYKTALQVLKRQATIMPPRDVEYLAMRGQEIILKRILDFQR